MNVCVCVCVFVSVCLLLQVGVCKRVFANGFMQIDYFTSVFASGFKQVSFACRFLQASLCKWVIRSISGFLQVGFL